MGFESPHSFKEIHEIQPALKNIIKKVIEDFEQDKRYWGNLEYKGPITLRYENMNINKLFQLHLTAGDLRNKVKRMKENFTPSLDEKTLTILNDIENETNAIIQSKLRVNELEEKLTEEWEEKGQDDSITIDAEHANILSEQVYKIEQNIKKLKDIYMTDTKNDEDNTYIEGTTFSKN